MTLVRDDRRIRIPSEYLFNAISANDQQFTSIDFITDNIEYTVYDSSSLKRKQTGVFKGIDGKKLVPNELNVSCASLSGSMEVFIAYKITSHAPSAARIEGPPPPKGLEPDYYLTNDSIMLGDTKTGVAREIASIHFWRSRNADYRTVRQTLISLDHGRSVGYLSEEGKVYFLRNVIPD